MAGDYQPSATTARVLTGAANVLVTHDFIQRLRTSVLASLTFCSTQMGDVAAIGEVGLDGSSRYRKSYDVQRGLLRPSLNVARHWAVVCSAFIHAKL
jgi:Tat protein secretion system quality control protein TatD with DNase activity